MKAENHYDILGISLTAKEGRRRASYREIPADEIKLAYHAKAREYRDALNNPVSPLKARLQHINDAYGVLKNPETRRRHDCVLDAEMRRQARNCLFEQQLRRAEEERYRREHGYTRPSADVENILNDFISRRDRSRQNGLTYYEQLMRENYARENRKLVRVSVSMLVGLSYLGWVMQPVYMPWISKAQANITTMLSSNVVPVQPRQSQHHDSPAP